MVPEGWKREPLVNVAEIRTGVAKGKKDVRDPISVPYLRVANVQDGRIDLTEVKTIDIEREQLSRYALEDGDVLMTEGGDFDKLGRGDVWKNQISPCINQNHVFAVRVDQSRLLPYYLSALSSSHYGKSYFLSCAKKSTNLASINSTQLKEFPVLIPPLVEQTKIEEILTTWDRAIETTANLIENCGTQRQALVQQLLTGKKRFLKFVGTRGNTETRFGDLPTDWQLVPISEIANEESERAGSNFDVPVLSCSKYEGFVDSLKYFKKKVYSDDTSNYKVVHRGHYGFPSNHIEEGSIGYQDVCDAGIVSPIYTVFKTNDQIHDGYLYRLLKTEHYRQLFAARTNASVDRRGSLRWKEFSKIRVPVPSLPEQLKISETIDAADAELAILEGQLLRLRTEKRALMQQLLTGRRRVNLAA